jgi:hypothetical protein
VVNTNGALVSTPVLTQSVATGGERGLLGLTFSANGSKLYVFYNEPGGDIQIDEYAMSGSVANVGSRRPLLTIEHSAHSNHNGGQILRGPDSNLYIATGDGGGTGDPDGNAQDRNSLLGKILRINPTANGGNPYTIPSSNPYVGQAGRKGEIWMYGLRNPWRFTFDRAVGSMWIGDVGQSAWEEVDHAGIGQKGLNFGWPLREGFHAYSGAQPSNGVNPVFEVSQDTGACAIIGGYIYRGERIADLGGAYLYGDSCRSGISAVSFVNGVPVQRRDLGIGVPDLSSFGEDHNGELYAASRGGTIYRLDPGPRSVGYWVAATDGRVFGYGGAPSCNPSARTATSPVVAIAGRNSGYWTVARNGAVVACRRRSHGSMLGRPLAFPVVGMALTTSRGGYWLVASDGGVFSFGNAQYYGSTGGRRLNRPIVGIAKTKAGNGYWLVASDGGIFTFGDAKYYGSTGGRILNRPIVAMAATASGKGYWLVASDGGVFTFGNARYFGSTGGQSLPGPIAAMSVTPTGNGYWLLGANGSVYPFGDAQQYGGPVGAGAFAVGIDHV